jgi:hypothetical protein
MDKPTTSGVAPIVADTQAYERWLHKRVDVVESDVALSSGFCGEPSIAGPPCGRRRVLSWTSRHG